MVEQHREAAEAVVQGEVEVVTYRDPESGYSVVKVFPERGYGDPEDLIRARVTCVGHAGELPVGARLRATGHWTRHATHGRQLEFHSLERLAPEGAAGLVRYLSSSAFKGVGPKLAERIVERLGDGAIARIRADRSCLEEIEGLRPKVAAELAAALERELGSAEVRAFLLGVGLGPWQAEAVNRSLGGEAEARLRADPYVIASGIRGIGFQTADRIAQSLGFAEDAPERARAGLLFALRTAASDGHSCEPRERLFAETRDLLRAHVAEDALADALRELERRGDVVVEDDPRPGATEPLVYLPPYHVSEARLAEHVAQLLGAGPLRPLATEEHVDIAARAAGLALHSAQRAAVAGLLREPVALLTGGPGVGKTTIVRLVVALAERGGCTVKLASPTGRAAKRLAEASGHEASTVHRLLGWEPQRGAFAHDATNPLEADLVVVDEVSMLDVVMAHHLAKAIQPPTRLVLVGDPDQLPSVSAGNVLADLLASGVVPTFRLTQIFRQDEASRIVANAHRILSGEEPEFCAGDEASGDFFLFPAEDDAHCAELLVDVVTQRIPRRFGLSWQDDVQVLAPMYRGACGVDALNERLRAALPGPGRALEHRGRSWRTGDRVIHTRNDYEKEIFNGDVGRIERIAADGSFLVVRYPEREVIYRTDELGDLQPAFAITVHRSQGGEYPAVVLPLTTRHWLMLQRHLFYTAITRAQKLVVLVGSRRALKKAVEDAEQRHRESALADRLRARLES